MNAPRTLAVVSRRSEPADSLDYFPTPPWATRALMEHVIPESAKNLGLVREPACGEGHMAAVIAEYTPHVMASDIHDYGYGKVLDYTTFEGVGVGPDWVITNPPFNQAEAFLNVALGEARVGVALLLRSVWMHGVKRHKGIFAKRPPNFIAPFAERVPMVKGRWDPAASTATDYCWFVWIQRGPNLSMVSWIPPGQRLALTGWADYDRFAPLSAAPLLDGGAA